MNKKLNLIFVSATVLIWLVIAIWNVFTPYRFFSENENKSFIAFPHFSVKDVLSGEYMEKIDQYINEQFVLREECIAVKAVSEYVSGKRESKGIYVCGDSLMQKLGLPKEENLKVNTDAINTFIKEYDLPVSVMIVPTASEIQKDKLPYGASPWDQKSVIKDIYSSIPGADCIDVTPVLTEHKEEYIFYRTDHHWTTYGSYFAYRKYCEEKQFDNVSRYDVEQVSDSFNGTSYSKSGIRFIEPDTMFAYMPEFDCPTDIYSGNVPQRYDSMYFDEYLSVKDKYSYFLGENKPLMTIYGNSELDRELLMFKDSFAHCLTPFLLENYSKITLVDCRYMNFPLNGIINIEDYDDVLFLFGIESFTTTNELQKLPYLAEKPKSVSENQ